MKEELVQAVRQKRVADVRELLSAGANPDARDAEGDCVLWWAANDGHVEIVRLLVAAGADLDLIPETSYLVRSRARRHEGRLPTSPQRQRIQPPVPRAVPARR